MSLFLCFALAAGASAASSPSDLACSGPGGTGRDAGCATRQAAADYSALRKDTLTRLGQARKAAEAALELEPLDAPGPVVDFNVYFSLLKSDEDAFLRPHDAGGLRAAHSKWQAAYLQLHEALGRARDRVQPVSVELAKSLAGVPPILDELARAAKTLQGGSNDLDDLKAERADLEKRVRAFDKELRETTLPAVGRAAEAMKDLLFWLDGDNSGLQSRIAEGLYNDEWDDDDARRGQTERAEKIDAKELRSHKSADLAEIQKTLDILNGDEWSD